MDGVDRGDQHRNFGAGFTNVSHFQKLYKKAFLRIYYFSLLQEFSAWNMLVDEFKNIGRDGVTRRNSLVK